MIKNHTINEETSKDVLEAASCGFQLMWNNSVEIRKESRMPRNKKCMG